MRDWYMESGSRGTVDRAHGTAWSESQSGWVELGSTSDTTPVFWKGKRGGGRLTDEERAALAKQSEIKRQLELLCEKKRTIEYEITNIKSELQTAPKGYEAALGGITFAWVAFCHACILISGGLDFLGTIFFILGSIINTLFAIFGIKGFLQERATIAEISKKLTAAQSELASTVLSINALKRNDWFGMR